MELAALWTMRSATAVVTTVSLWLHRERMRRLAELLQHSLWRKVSEGTRAAVLETLGCLLEAAPQVSGLTPLCM